MASRQPHSGVRKQDCRIRLTPPAAGSGFDVVSRRSARTTRGTFLADVQYCGAIQEQTVAIDDAERTSGYLLLPSRGDESGGGWLATAGESGDRKKAILRNDVRVADLHRKRGDREREVRSVFAGTERCRWELRRAAWLRRDAVAHCRNNLFLYQFRIGLRRDSGWR